MTSTNYSWSTLIDRYSKELSASDYPRGTIYLRGYHLRRFAKTVAVGPDDVTRDMVLRFLDNPDWAPSYRRSFRVTLRAFYRWGAENDVLDAEPMRGVKSVAAPTGRPRPAPEEAVRAGKMSTDARVVTMVKLAATAGLRCCEIAIVRRDDVFRSGDGWMLRVHGKGRKIRTIPVTASLALEIRNADGYLFPGKIDGHLSASYVSKLLSRALPDGWTGHTLRHRFASRAYIGAGKDIRAVQELLGHASVATTQIYTAVEDDALRRAVEFAA